jgi:allantoate deiminase
VQTTADVSHLAQEVIDRCRRLASFSEDPDSIRRTFLSPPMHQVHQEIAAWLEPLGVTPRVDAVGNLRAALPGPESAPRLLLGSHLDTVPNAGPFDGILGVVLGTALLQESIARKFPYAIELIGFSEEEGVRFGVPFIGSRALVGRIDDDLLARQDERGTTVRQAIKDFGLRPEQIPQATLSGDVGGYLEFHIEQGPVLEKLGLPLAAVESIAGQTRMDFIFNGRTNHAGTTPMDLRYDAVACAAEWVGCVERVARSTPGLVATVGSFEAKPGATNVIAGEARLTLDVRHGSDPRRTQAVDDLIRQSKEVAGRRGLSVRSFMRMNQAAVNMDPELTNQVEMAISKSGCKPHRMVSGAGHDAMILAERVPAAMIFVRTPGGVSHDPAESVAVDDVAKAIECGLHLLDQLASSKTLRARTCRA